MSAQVFRCTELAEKLVKSYEGHAKDFASEFGRAPCLTVVLVGDDPASKVYVNSKKRICEKHSINASDVLLPTNISAADLEAELKRLNEDDNVDGILVQSPLPADLDERYFQPILSPEKDVDCFHPENVGQFTIDPSEAMKSGMVPCTPAGVMEVLRELKVELTGLNAVVVGRSNLVGKPMAQLLMAANATVTICHSRTKNLPAICSRADVIVSAVGKPKFLSSAHVKENAILIDVGVNRIEVDGKSVLVGDFDRNAVLDHAKIITPVPKGIGPMTIALLVRNTVRAAWLRKKSQSPV